MDPLIWAFALTTGLGVGMAMLVVWAIHSVQRERTRAAVDWGRRLLAAQDEERCTIARELHDGFVQEIESLGMLFTRNGVEAGTTRAFTLAQQVRTVSRGLHPGVLNALTLTDGVRELATTESAEAFRVTLTHGDLPVLDFLHRLTAYRIVQEAVSNARRHAGATQVDITINAVADAIDVTIHDNGRGFVVPPEAALVSLGLRSMRERALALGGTLTILSTPGEGATVVAHLPGGSPP